MLAEGQARRRINAAASGGATASQEMATVNSLAKSPMSGIGSGGPRSWTLYATLLTSRNVRAKDERTAKFTFCASRMVSVAIPITLPLWSRTGEPLDPGWTSAEIWTIPRLPPMPVSPDTRRPSGSAIVPQTMGIRIRPLARPAGRSDRRERRDTLRRYVGQQQRQICVGVGGNDLGGHREVAGLLDRDRFTCVGYVLVGQDVTGGSPRRTRCRSRRLPPSKGRHAR